MRRPAELLSGAGSVREWGGFDLIPHDRFRYAFQRWRPYWSLDFMSPDDRATYSHFPDEGITIFRGQDRNRRLGLSWTINREVAEGFARGHRNFRYRNLIVLQAVIDKSSIAFVSNDQEAQIVLFARPNVRAFFS